MDEPFVAAADLARRLGVSPDTVTRWCREGRIPGIKPGRDWRIPASVADDLLAGRPARYFTAELAQHLARLRPSDHVLVMVPGGRRHASDLRQVLERLAGVAPGPPPLPPPGGDLFARAFLAAGARARAVAEADHAPVGRVMVRWVSGFETDAGERRMARVARERGATVLCVLPLEGHPDLGPLVAAHTHVLVSLAHGRSWLGAGGAERRAVGA